VSTPPLPFHPEVLLSHRAFVGALARSLVRDEATAEDVVQETWLTSLTRPPHSADSLRMWLARVTRSKALDALRGEDRRTQRERSVARAESDESSEHLRERVALEHRVVAAVLALREPYRGTVLLRYYEGLTPAEIANRRGAPAGTVRAQLARALQLLRQELEGEFGGDRTACSVALIDIARRWELGAQSKLASGALLQYAIVGLVASAVVVVPIALWARAHRASDPTVAASLPTPSTMEAATSTSKALTAPSERTDPNVREAIAASEQDPAIQGVVARYDLASRSIPQLHDLVGSIQQVLRERWLTVPPRIEAEQAALLRLPDTGVARILERTHIGNFFESGFVGIRGGGAYFSFATGSNDFNGQPTLELQGGLYSSGISGAGAVLDLGRCRLTELSSADSPPAELTDAQRELWTLMWTETKTTEQDIEAALQRRKYKPLADDRCAASAGSTYLVRSVSSGRHDVLAAFTCLERNAVGDTIAWRLLRRAPMPGEVLRGPFAKPAVASSAPVAAEPERWLIELADEQLVAIVGSCRALGTERLLAVPQGVSGSVRGCSVARVLRGDECERLVDKRGGGSFYSFATQDQSYDREPDIQFDDGRFSTGFYGRSFGAIIDVGEIPLAELRNDGASIPAGLSDPQREAWRFLWSVTPSEANPNDPKELWVSQADFKRASDLQLRRTPAVVGHTYVVRAALPGEHDLIVAFTVLSEDDYGVFLAWRTLRVLEK
jgi:RNA polymerase sigma-70 factor (ECF subfamily)